MRQLQPASPTFWTQHQCQPLHSQSPASLSTKGGSAWFRQRFWHLPPIGLHGPTPSWCDNNKHRKHSHSYFNSGKLTTHGQTPPPSKPTVGSCLIGNTSPMGRPVPVFTTILKTGLRWGEAGSTQQLQPPTQYSKLKSAIGLTSGAKRCLNHKQGHTPAEHSPQSHTTMATATRGTSSACFF